MADLKRSSGHELLTKSRVRDQRGEPGSLSETKSGHEVGEGNRELLPPPDPDLPNAQNRYDQEHHKPTAEKSSRFYMLTSWVPLVREEFDPKKVAFVIWQGEISPKTGKYHCQIYMELRDSMKYVAAAKALGLEKGEWWCRPRFSERDNCVIYCTKEESRLHGDGPYQWGEPTKQGGRGQTTALVHAIKEGKSNRQLIEEFPDQYMKYYKAVQHVRYELNPRRTWRTKVIWIEGPPETGKSELAKAICTELGFDYNKEFDVYWKRDNTKWMDNYFGQKVVIYDEFKYEEGNRDTMLAMMWKDPLQLQYKGGYMNWSAEWLIVTTNFALPWDGEVNQSKAWERRINKLVSYFPKVVKDQKSQDVNDLL